MAGLRWGGVVTAACGLPAVHREGQSNPRTAPPSSCRQGERGSATSPSFTCGGAAVLPVHLAVDVLCAKDVDLCVHDHLPRRVLDLRAFIHGGGGRRSDAHNNMPCLLGWWNPRSGPMGPMAQSLLFSAYLAALSRAQSPLPQQCNNPAPKGVCPHLP